MFLLAFQATNMFSYSQKMLSATKCQILDYQLFVFHLKDSAIINEDNLSMFHRCGIMALVAAYLNFVSQMIAVPAFCQHVSKVMCLGNSFNLALY